jgi:hypothetical protein
LICLDDEILKLRDSNIKLVDFYQTVSTIKNVFGMYWSLFYADFFFNQAEILKYENIFLPRKFKILIFRSSSN